MTADADAIVDAPAKTDRPDTATLDAPAIADAPSLINVPVELTVEADAMALTPSLTTRPLAETADAAAIADAPSSKSAVEYAARPYLNRPYNILCQRNIEIACRDTKHITSRNSLACR